MGLLTITNKSGNTSLTPFLVSLTVIDICNNTPVPPYDTTLYHNGIGQYPDLGDIIYTNLAGTIPFNGSGQMDSGVNFLTDVNGIRKNN